MFITWKGSSILLFAISKNCNVSFVKWGTAPPRLLNNGPGVSISGRLLCTSSTPALAAQDKLLLLAAAFKATFSMINFILLCWSYHEISVLCSCLKFSIEQIVLNLLLIFSRVSLISTVCWFISGTLSINFNSFSSWDRTLLFFVCNSGVELKCECHPSPNPKSWKFLHRKCSILKGT